MRIFKVEPLIEKLNKSLENLEAGYIKPDKEITDSEYFELMNKLRKEVESTHFGVAGKEVNGMHYSIEIKYQVKTKDSLTQKTLLNDKIFGYLIKEREVIDLINLVSLSKIALQNLIECIQKYPLKVPLSIAPPINSNLELTNPSIDSSFFNISIQGINNSTEFLPGQLPIYNGFTEQAITENNEALEKASCNISISSPSSR